MMSHVKRGCSWPRKVEVVKDYLSLKAINHCGQISLAGNNASAGWMSSLVSNN